MIYTITLNPAVDYFLTINGELMNDEVNRGTNEIFKAGGKGLNVSKTLSLMKIKSNAIAILGGFTGDFILDSFSNDEYISMIPIKVNGINRINMKAHHNQSALCINGQGPTIDKKVQYDLLSELKKIKEDDIVVVSGSLMNGFTEDFIAKMGEQIKELRAKLVIDMETITIDTLKACSPYLIKPNLYELQLLFNDLSIAKENVFPYLKQIHDIGVENILLSLGKDGAIYSTKESNYKLNQPQTTLVNKVGAGDAMLAAFIGKLSVNESLQEALRYAGAAGNAVASKLEDIAYEDIEAQLSNMSVEEIRP